MEINVLIERIKNPKLLANDNNEEWHKLTNNHPYFSVAQLLQFGNDYFNEKDKLEFVAQYKSDPIKFASFVNEIKNTTPFFSSQKEKNKEKTESKELPAKLNEEKIITIQTPSNSNTNTTNNTIKESIEVKETQPKEDILSLINNLPSSQNIDEIATITASHLSTNEQQLEREKSLMVMMSFTDWLNHFKLKKENEEEEELEKKALKTAWQKEKLTAIIEEEQDEIPEIIFKQAMDSISVENALISESLAEILAKQGKIDRAIDMYKKLSLRNPEKNSYFADRIKELLTN